MNKRRYYLLGFLLIVLCCACSVSKKTGKQVRQTDYLQVVVADTFVRESLKSVDFQKQLQWKRVLFTPPDSAGKQYIHSVTLVESQSKTSLTETESEQQVQSADITRQTAYTYKESKTGGWIPPAGCFLLLVLVLCLWIPIRRIK